MDRVEHAARLCKMVAVLDALKSDPATPWYLVEMADQMISLIDDLDDLGQSSDKLDADLVKQQKDINRLQDRYSEMLYKLNSGD